VGPSRSLVFVVFLSRGSSSAKKEGKKEGQFSSKWRKTEGSLYPLLAKNKTKELSTEQKIKKKPKWVTFW